jgi:hypothetical protein
MFLFLIIVIAQFSFHQKEITKKKKQVIVGLFYLHILPGPKNTSAPNRIYLRYSRRSLQDSRI